MATLFKLDATEFNQTIDKYLELSRRERVNELNRRAANICARAANLTPRANPDRIVRDMMICLGGDGSFLRAVRYIRDSQVPILGINTGRLGFLTNISKEAIADTFHLIEQKKYEFQLRSLLRVRTETNHAARDAYFIVKRQGCCA